MTLQSDLERTFTPAVNRALDSSMIKLLVGDLVQRIKEYSKSQIELWKQIPSWALEADGRGGYNGQLSRAYIQGCWAIESSAKGGCYQVYINLKTGELIEPAPVAYGNKTQPAQDESILCLALNIDEIDANKILKELKEKAQESPIQYYNSMTQREREELRKELGLAPVAI